MIVAAHSSVQSMNGRTRRLRAAQRTGGFHSSMESADRCGNLDCRILRPRPDGWFGFEQRRDSRAKA
jgi:hypothetical protein